MKFVYAGLDVPGFEIAHEVPQGNHQFTVKSRHVYLTERSNRSGQSLGRQDMEYPYRIPLSLVSLSNGLRFLVPKGNDENVWRPPNFENTKINDVQHGMNGKVIPGSPSAVLKTLAWTDLSYGIAHHSDCLYRLHNGDVSIGMHIHPDDHEQNLLTFSWESPQDYGFARVELIRTYNTTVPPLRLSVDTPLHNVNIAFTPPNFERQELEYAERHVSVQNEETGEEVFGDAAMKKLKNIGLYVPLPERLGREEIKSIISNVVGDITANGRMRNPILYFL